MAAELPEYYTFNVRTLGGVDLEVHVPALPPEALFAELLAFLVWQQLGLPSTQHVSLSMDGISRHPPHPLHEYTYQPELVFDALLREVPPLAAQGLTACPRVFVREGAMMTPAGMITDGSAMRTLALELVEHQQTMHLALHISPGSNPNAGYALLLAALPSLYSLRHLSIAFMPTADVLALGGLLASTTIEELELDECVLPLEFLPFLSTSHLVALHVATSAFNTCTLAPLIAAAKKSRIHKLSAYIQPCTIDGDSLAATELVDARFTSVSCFSYTSTTLVAALFANPAILHVRVDMASTVRGPVREIVSELWAATPAHLETLIISNGTRCPMEADRSFAARLPELGLTRLELFAGAFLVTADFACAIFRALPATQMVTLSLGTMIHGHTILATRDRSLCRHLGEALQQTPTLRVLRLQSIELIAEQEYARVLIKGLASAHLSELVISNLEIRGDDVASFVRAAGANQTLVKLQLDGRLFSSDAVDALIEVCRACLGMRHAGVDFTYGYTGGGVSLVNYMREQVAEKGWTCISPPTARRDVLHPGVETEIYMLLNESNLHRGLWCQIADLCDDDDMPALE